MKKLLVLLLSLMLVTSILALGEELSVPVENPENNIVLPVEPPVAEPNLGDPMNPPPQPENQPPQENPEKTKYQPQPPMGNPGQPQYQPQPPMNKPSPPNNFNKPQPQWGNQPGKYPPPKDHLTGDVTADKDKQEMLPPLNENEGSEQDQPKEIPEDGGSWVPLKKIGNFFYFWKPKETPKEQFGNLQNPPKKLGDIKNGPKIPLPGKPQDGTEQDEEDNQDLENGDQDFQDTYEKDKSNTKVDVKKFKGPGEADAAFEQAFKDGNMKIVLVKNMKLVKRTTGEMDEYLWPAHDKIISLSIPTGEPIEQNLVAFEYLSKYPSKLNPKSDTLGLPGEGMNFPPLEETPEFENGDFKEGQEADDSPAMPKGTGANGKNKNQFSPPAPPGCKISEKKGVPTGFRLINEGSSQYCDLDDQLHPQKELNESCQNNFECQSNQCSSGKCLDLSAKLEETQGLLQKILAWLGAKE